ncbi:hypothetical protein H6G89_30300 [Oscillatoria sp. FACHB-1407]|uniref:hypothetical protein n=1 Tax=Oscillatoria sp. FACHB-1407 TaxID=2692847 RepID=UPI0016824B2A|nr:hypothetical protein [Oscillatoria sp. FACHB-1407]MBD2465305.1 hypothetical protein [Oscillatoria sp. FACHB-1407]
MLGTFQQSHLRIEVEATETVIRDSLLCSAQFQQWMFPQQFPAGLPDQLQEGTIFTSRLGPIAVRHQVQKITPNGLCLLMSQGIDGCHRWSWGEGWIQSCLEGVSVLPLNLGQTLSLMRLREFLKNQSQPQPTKIS